MCPGDTIHMEVFVYVYAEHVVEVYELVPVSV